MSAPRTILAVAIASISIFAAPLARAQESASPSDARAPAEAPPAKPQNHVVVTATGGYGGTSLFGTTAFGPHGTFGVGGQLDVLRLVGYGTYESYATRAGTPIRGGAAGADFMVTPWRLYLGLGGSVGYYAFGRTTRDEFVGSAALTMEGIVGADVFRFDDHALALEARGGARIFSETIAPEGRLSLAFRY